MFIVRKPHSVFYFVFPIALHLNRRYLVRDCRICQPSYRVAVIGHTHTHRHIQFIYTTNTTPIQRKRSTAQHTHMMTITSPNMESEHWISNSNDVVFVTKSIKFNVAYRHAIPLWSSDRVKKNIRREWRKEVSPMHFFSLLHSFSFRWSAIAPTSSNKEL